MGRRNCPLCGCQKDEFLFYAKGSPGPLVKCSSCGFLFINPIEDDKALIEDGPMLNGQNPGLIDCSDISLISQWEQSLIKEYMSEESAKRRNAESAISRINRTCVPPGRLLDVGCFCGLFLDVARESGWECEGIEPLLGPSIYARGRFGLNVITNTLSNCRLEPEQYDLITSFQVFEHLLQPASELAIINSLLKPGGVVVVEVPSLTLTAAKLLKGRHRHFVQDHVSFFNKSTLVRAMENAGFSAIDIWYPSRIMTFDHLFGWLKRRSDDADSGRRQAGGLHSGILSRTVKVNLLDIVSVMARKMRSADSPG